MIKEMLINYELNENNEFLEAVPNIPNIKRHALQLVII